MTRHLTAFLIKFVATFTLLYFILGATFQLTVTEILLLSAGLGIITYIIGDVFILARTNNALATIADLAFSWAIVYQYLNMFTPFARPFLTSFLTAIGVSIFELFFHRLMERNVFRFEVNNRRVRHQRYQTEFAEELNTEEIREKNRRNR